MGKPAARLSDMHTCPLANPGPVPHVGGPISGPGAATVHIGGIPAAVLGDMATCTGPPDTIVSGSSGVHIMGKPAARVGDMTAHGGTIVKGEPTVLIGETAGGSAGAGGAGSAMGSTGDAPPAPAPLTTQGALAPAASSQSGGRGQGGSGQFGQSDDNPTWIGFQLLTHDGQPVPDEPFSATLDTGQTLSGRTDARGYAEFSGIADHSRGEVEFSDIPLDDTDVTAPVPTQTSDRNRPRPAPRPSGPPAARDAQSGR